LKCGKRSYAAGDRSLLKKEMRENSIFYPQPGNDATPVDRGNTFSRLVGNQLTVFYLSID
jgi:hypothetical protein